ncbi:hypothetical protein DXT76_13510 [Halobacillus trueperi]|uniref:DUF2508 family protein n=1 Tax=Halobacillus trueperi TaxID=156205 RepID=A0A3D8VLX3_9BACI|nr:hypothetical protein [Halobacillus trueperi]RDY70287.1 hypothetical protein DXT76_13510 [Halobacillus trueperi]
MNSDLYLPQDIAQAVEEHCRFWEAIREMEQCFAQEDLNGLIAASEDTINSARTLEKMRERKARQDELFELSKSLYKQGVLCAVVGRYEVEKKA